KLEAKLNESSAVSKFVRGDSAAISVKSIQGMFYQKVFFVDEADHTKFLKNLNWSLKSGKLPQKDTSQIALSHRVAINKGLKIGDFVGREATSSSEYLPGKFEVVGILDTGEADGGLADLTYHIKDYPNQTPLSWQYFVFSDNQTKIEELFHEIKKEDISGQLSITNYKSEIELLNSLNQTFDTVNWILNLIITVTICAVMILLNQINMFVRQSEIGILLAIGYTKIHLAIRFMLESFAQVAVSYALGMGLISLICYLVNILFFQPAAISTINPWNMEIVLLSLPLPIVTFTSTLVLFVAKFRNVDPVSLIE
ncbi:MAG: ABC transporter permease, partial [Flammeovirgaceae bacterium]